MRKSVGTRLRLEPLDDEGGLRNEKTDLSLNVIRCHLIVNMVVAVKS